MRVQRGMLIAVEGVDGSGKNTQIQALKVALQELGYKVSTYSFPDYGYSELGPSIRKMLAGEFGNASQINPILSAPLFALERAEKRDLIIEDIGAGKIVLCDRYVYSNVAHQACRVSEPERKNFQLLIEKIEFNLLGLPKADMTILLDVDDATSGTRRKVRADLSQDARPLDDYEKDTVGLSLARSIYVSLAKDLEWIVIPAESNGKKFSPTEITYSILQKIKPLLVNCNEY